MTEPSPPTPGKPPLTKRRFPWRRLFQYRLRTLLIVTTITAIALGWWTHKARQQREAVAAFQEIGGRVEYDSSLPWTGGMKAPPKYPQWLLDKVGVDLFASVQTLVLYNTQHTLPPHQTGTRNPSASCAPMATAMLTAANPCGCIVHMPHTMDRRLSTFAMHTVRDYRVGRSGSVSGGYFVYFKMNSTTRCGSGWVKWCPWDSFVPCGTEITSIVWPSFSSRCLSR